MLEPSDASRKITQPPTPFSPVQWDHGIIPKTHNNRTLVLCFDGTGDKFDSDNSNVVEFISLLKKDKKHEQMVYYQTGIGTYVAKHGPVVFTSIFKKVSKVLDAAVAWNLASHTQCLHTIIKSSISVLMGPFVSWLRIFDAALFVLSRVAPNTSHYILGFHFILDQYGDKICIFGFSRGAYTARALAGMLAKVGLLPADNNEQIPFAYKMYTQDDAFGWEQSSAFKKTFSIDVDVEFLGVWDTVNSVGLIPHRLPFTISNSSIKYFRHALSLDERRAKFKANLCPPGDKDQGFLHADVQEGTSKVPRKRPTLNELERQWSDNSRRTDVLEVWFSGCHCDVGGGAVKNGTRHALSRIPLRWMIRECFLAHTGIMFKTDGLKEVGLDPSRLYPNVLPRPKALYVKEADPNRICCKIGIVSAVEPGIILNEEEEDLADALSPINDQLSLSPIWWLLELLPMRQKCLGKDGTLEAKIKINLAKGRFLPQDGNHPVLVHRTVKLRVDHPEVFAEGPYVPRAGPWDTAKLVWVD
ncbi:hypothetical protein BJ322DRAFT_667687 [Thelephora terrestris]|uniref:T6SS Phospholipase effector Tle1-like catalytic domain-containing protein n=1 Tax=Thelephora terrestris TaxID=56493 RepID=A0A9P6HGL2_9AGAM|nr:hypothetical protein BJ322DRAFT_667687 [Thelephora terrestris]